MDNLHEHIRKQETLYKGGYLNLERYHITSPDGSHAIREVVQVNNAVAILPVNDNGLVYTIRQHRAAIGKTIIEIPAGIIDGDETEEAAAVRECEEETGYKPRTLTRLIRYAHAEGYSTGWMTLFAGTDLVHTGNTHFDSSEFIEVYPQSIQDIFEKIDQNIIIDSKTIISIMLYHQRFHNKGRTSL